MYSLQSIQWMIGCMELCGGLHFRTILFPSSAFTLTFFSFCWDGGAKGRQGRKNTRMLVCTQTCTQPPVRTFPASCQVCLRRFMSCVDFTHTMQWMRGFIYKIPVWGTLRFKERRVQRRRQVVFCLAEVEWRHLWVICVCPPTPPLFSLLITPQELLKSTSHETVVRETVKEGGRPGERQSHRWMDTQRCSLLLPRGPCVLVCVCVRECMLIIMLLHVIIFWVAVYGEFSVWASIC